MFKKQALIDIRESRDDKMSVKTCSCIKNPKGDLIESDIIHRMTFILHHSA